MQNLERFIRRIGKLDEFHAWVREKGEIEGEAEAAD